VAVVAVDGVLTSLALLAVQAVVLLWVQAQVMWEPLAEVQPRLPLLVELATVMLVELVGA